MWCVCFAVCLVVCFCGWRSGAILPQWQGLPQGHLLGEQILWGEDQGPILRVMLGRGGGGASQSDLLGLEINPDTPTYWFNS